LRARLARLALFTHRSKKTGGTGFARLTRPTHCTGRPELAFESLHSALAFGALFSGRAGCTRRSGLALQAHRSLRTHRSRLAHRTGLSGRTPLAFWSGKADGAGRAR
jgi:hypothetical protein